MQFFQASLLNTEKNWQRDGRGKWGGKSQTQLLQHEGGFSSVSSFTAMWKTQTFKLFSLPPVPMPHIPPNPWPPDTRGQPHSDAELNSLPWTTLHSHFYFKALLKFPRLPLVRLHYSLCIVVQHERPSERLEERASTKRTLLNIIKSAEVG